MRRTPTAPARPSKSASRASTPSFGASLRSGLGQFLYDTRSEFRKIVWPTREEATNLTGLVVAVSVAVAMFIGAVDLVFSQIFKLLVGGG